MESRITQCTKRRGKGKQSEFKRIVKNGALCILFLHIPESLFSVPGGLSVPGGRSKYVVTSVKQLFICVVLTSKFSLCTAQIQKPQSVRLSIPNYKKHLSLHTVKALLSSLSNKPHSLLGPLLGLQKIFN